MVERLTGNETINVEISSGRRGARGIQDRLGLGGNRARSAPEGRAQQPTRARGLIGKTEP